MNQAGRTIKTNRDHNRPELQKAVKSLTDYLFHEWEQEKKKFWFTKSEARIKVFGDSEQSLHQIFDHWNNQTYFDTLITETNP